MEPHTQAPGSELLNADETASARLEHAAAKAHAPDIPLLEWMVALVGAALVGFVLGWIAWHGITRDATLPHFLFEVQSVTKLSNGYLVTVQATNQGGQTAGDVKLEGVLSSSAGEVETAEMTFKYLPPHSPKQGGLFFVKDPRALKLTLTAKGYEAP
jgi:uncharacterized protein (TIGR02588 family)